MSGSYLILLENRDRAEQLAAFDFPKNMVSSAKRIWFMGGQCHPTLTPGKVPLACACRHSPEKTSVHRMNRYGESGSPCRRPLEGLTVPCGPPFIEKEYDTEETHSISQEIIVSWKPNLLSTSRKKLHSILSYALLMSVLTAMATHFLSPDFLK